MGSWNETCGVTQLPILWKDKVRLFILIPSMSNDQSSTTCHPEDRFVPFALPVLGTYDDYGGIEDVVQDWNTKLIEKWARTSFVSEPDALGKTLPIDTTENLVHAIERGQVYTRLSCAHPSGSVMGQAVLMIRPALMMVREEVWEFMSAGYDTWCGNETAETLVQEFLSEEKKQGDELFPPPSNAKLARWMQDFGIGSSVRGIRNYKNFVESPDARKEAALHALAELYMFNTNMGLLRRQFIPQTGAGSQNTSWDLHQKLSELVVDRVRRNLEEDEDV